MFNIYLRVKKNTIKLLPERVQRLQRHDHGVGGRRVHEGEAQQVVDAHGLQLQHRRRQVGALDLGHVGGQHLVSARGGEIIA